MSKRKKAPKPVAVNVSGGGAGQVPPRASSEFAPDYSYVRKDLRRIALIAGGILAVLLVLAIVLN